jgi:hypothetical protein
VKKISQGGTSYISLRTHDTTSDGLYIQKSTRARSTEIDALQSPQMPSHELDDVIREPKPSPDHRWCSGCNSWQKPSGFGKDAAAADGLDHYCRTCRKEQERRWSLHRAFAKIFPKRLT